MANLLPSLQTYIGPDMIGASAKMLDEKENDISKAVGSIAPAILMGLLEKSSDAHALDIIFDKISQFDPNTLNHLAGLVGSGNLAHNDPKDFSGDLLGTVFGSKVPAITNAVAAFSSVKQSSASALLGLVGPVVMGLLSKRIRIGALNRTGFVNLLRGEASSFMSMLPPGIAAVMGLSQFNTGTSEAVKYGESTVGNHWLIALLLLFAIGIGTVFYMKSCKNPDSHEAPTLGYGTLYEVCLVNEIWIG